jgi:hypothetical protein
LVGIGYGVWYGYKMWLAHGVRRWEFIGGWKGLVFGLFCGARLDSYAEICKEIRRFDDSEIQFPTDVDQATWEAAIKKLLERESYYSMGNFSAAMFHKARAEFGLPVLNQANYQIVRKFFYDQFRDHRVRLAHMWRVNALAAAFFTIVSRSDREALDAVRDEALRAEYSKRCHGAIPTN